MSGPLNSPNDILLLAYYPHSAIARIEYWRYKNVKRGGQDSEERNKETDEGRKPHDSG